MFEILAERESSTMVSNWTEYLCIRREADKTLVLAICGYPLLAEAEEFWDDDLEEFRLPLAIDGIAVRGVEDGWVFGGDLEVRSDEIITLNPDDKKKINDWLASVDWDDEDTRKIVSAAMETQ